MKFHPSRSWDSGEIDASAKANGLSVRTAVCVTPAVAEIVTGVIVPTLVEFTINVAEVDPIGTVTLKGTVTAGLLLDSVTIQSPIGAGPFSVTVPIEEYPEFTVDGFTDIEAADGGFTVTFADCIPLPVAVMITPSGMLAGNAGHGKDWPMWRLGARSPSRERRRSQNHCLID